MVRLFYHPPGPSLSGIEGLPVRRIGPTKKPWKESSLPGPADVPDFFPSLKDGGLWEFSGGMLIGLEPDMDRFQLGRAVLEAIGYALKKGLEILENETGPIRKFVTVGGQAKSQLWNQMKADMLGCPVEVPRVADAELLGGVMVFLTGQGIYSSLMEASKKLYSTREIVKPGEREYYDKKFIRYGELATEIRAFFMGNKKRLERL
jgi:xylulokinase